MNTYTIYLGAHPIACVADTNSAYACYEATKTIAEMTGGNASLVWDDTGEVIAHIDFTEEVEDACIPYCESINCGYWWQDATEDYPRCHYEGSDACPCEVDEYYEDDDCDYEVGYDPYMGCYTDDC